MSPTTQTLSQTEEKSEASSGSDGVDLKGAVASGARAGIDAVQSGRAEAAAKTVVKGGSDVVRSAAEGALAVVSDPKNQADAKTFVENGAKAAAGAVGDVVTAVSTAVSDPKNQKKAVDVAVGTADLAGKAAGQAAELAGKINWGGVGNFVKDALWEATSIPGLMRADEARRKGDTVGMIWEGGVAAVNLGGLVLTGGAANAGVAAFKGFLVAGLRNGAKEGMEKLALKIGEEATEGLVKNLVKIGTKELEDKAKDLSADQILEHVLKKGGGEAARESLEAVNKAFRKAGMKEIPEEMAERAANGNWFSKWRMEAIKKKNNAVAGSDEMQKKVADVTGGAVEKRLGSLLDDAKLKDVVADTVEARLSKVASRSKKELADELLSMGVDKKDVDDVAAGLKAAVGKRGSRGVYGKEFEAEAKEKIVDRVTAKVKEKISSKGFKEGFDEAADEGLEAVGKKYSLEDDVLKKIRSSMAKGFDKGLDDAVRSRVKKGVDEGFDRWRKNRRQKDRSTEEEPAGEAVKLEESPWSDGEGLDPASRAKADDAEFRARYRNPLGKNFWEEEIAGKAKENFEKGARRVDGLDGATRPHAAGPEAAVASRPDPTTKSGAA